MTNNAPVQACFAKTALPQQLTSSETVVVPAVRGTWGMKYGKHAYYFYNFASHSCLEFEIGHANIVKPGLASVVRAVKGRDCAAARLQLLFGKFNFGNTSLEQVMLMTSPHTITPFGAGIFGVNLMAYPEQIIVDCNEHTVLCKTNCPEGQVFGARQWYDPASQEIYCSSYSLADSLRRKKDPTYPVHVAIHKRSFHSDGAELLWEGPFADYLDDIVVNSTKEYCVICERGMYADCQERLLPSQILVLDLRSGQHWMLTDFRAAAHAQFDPQDPSVVYFSSHNFRFVRSSYLALLQNASYDLKFEGPASVIKYALGPDGPRQLASFTAPDLFRLTNFHVFIHRHRKVLAGMSTPDFIYLFDAETTGIIAKLCVSHQADETCPVRKVPCKVQTFCPSLNGEKLYVQTNRSFQIIDVESGKPDYLRPLRFHHSAAAHMQSSGDTSWQ